MKNGIDKKKNDMIDHLMEAIMVLRTCDECEKFFYDICSKKELENISRRVLIAKLIVDGETYRSILEKTNASNVTISRLKTVMGTENNMLEKVVKRAWL